ELLARREADDAREGQFLYFEIISRGDQLLLAGLQLDLGAKRVNGGRCAGLDLAIGLVIERLGGIDLGLRGIHARARGSNLQITVARGEDDEVARVLIGVLSGFDALLRGALGVDGAPIEDRLGETGARVEIGEWPDDTWNRGAGKIEAETELLQVDLRYVHIRGGGDVGQ